MNNKQQTAVDIAFEKLANQGLLITRDYKNLRAYIEFKEMEKEMTIKLYADYENYLEEAFKNQCGGQAVILSFQEFYEQRYGGGEQ